MHSRALVTMLSSLTTVTTTIAAALLATGLAAPSQAVATDTPAGSTSDRTAGTFSWNGTWRTSLWGDAVATHTPDPQGRADSLIFNWNSRPIQPHVPYGDAPLTVKDRAYGPWFESIYPGGIADSTEIRRGRIYLSVSPGGNALTGEYTVSPDPTMRTDFTATCVAGECLGNTASPAELANTDAADPTDPGGSTTLVVPRTGKIKGVGVVTKGTVARYKFRALDGVTAAFQCKVDRKKWRQCGSPYALRTETLEPGRHVLKVRAVLEGKPDKSPATKNIRIFARG